MSMTPKISVIVPVYNVEPYIRQCLDSIIQQTLKEIEIIIVNDCSPAGEEQIIREYMAEHPHIIYIKHDRNMGLAAARNTGFAHATGEYFACVDSDDFVETFMFEKLYQKAKKFDADIAMCELNKVTVSDSDYIYQAERTYPDFLCNDAAFSYKDMGTSFFYFRVGAFARIYKKTFYQKYIHYPVGHLYEDVIPYFTGMINASKIVLLSEPLYNYRINRAGSIMNGKTFVPDIFLYYRELFKLFKQKGIYDEYKIALLNFISATYYWYNDKPEELYSGIRNILSSEAGENVKFLSKQGKMFIKYDFMQKEKIRKRFKFLYALCPLKIFKKKLNRYQ